MYTLFTDKEIRIYIIFARVIWKIRGFLFLFFPPLISFLMWTQKRKKSADFSKIYYFRRKYFFEHLDKGNYYYSFISVVIIHLFQTIFYLLVKFMLRTMMLMLSCIMYPIIRIRLRKRQYCPPLSRKIFFWTATDIARKIRMKQASFFRFVSWYIHI